ncbi:MAG: NAD(P)/FAD-dependent oxidoreductase [Flavobacterium sp.]|jgi:NADH:ubiquinone reductase (H+-translocating)|uniref:NADH:ubiquinone reductase (non-electrogenic) n=1 Tax=Flavobacterium macrobrachii TaxID=591204 RepID=A0ABS2D1C6_9FLAO|nr:MULTISPECIES: NAD(P)/FAD-dependent oxidoreductase [Flavobacterium]MBM6501017.1 NAD(P)/FAD-dependent oxidoreductase [Flavobacterium macrobrachii]MCZ8091601.1 NAD(P)/FAD-dependent oxidoreductase [Flavobacterium sp.]MCZ8330283.1 NAD(P)/FAD-dependent oxidoreductase [Flavobacterium sp.]
MKKQIVIIGGGFAGLNFAKTISNNSDFEITLVDKVNYNFFPPLLYQVATGFLEISSISYPFRKMLSGSRIRFWMGELQEIVSNENKIILNNGELNFDYLVIATGTTTNYFGMENVKKNAIPMKTLEDALNMRNSMLQRIEVASNSKNLQQQEELMTIVVAGGGPTGVELSGMFAEMSKTIIHKEYPELSHVKNAKIYLVDGGPALLAPMSKNSQEETLKQIKKLGVEVQLNKQVVDYDGQTVSFKDGSTIRTRNLIWAAGVTAMRFKGLSDEMFGRSNRLLVDEFNKVVGTENIYAIGDTAFMETDKKFPNGHPQVAQPAMQQGKNLAKNLILALANKPQKPFQYYDKGSMAIIGRNKAVVDLPKPKVHFKGFLAWMAWLFVHLMSLSMPRNKVNTLYHWALAYFSKNSSLRMIIRPERKN